MSEFRKARVRAYDEYCAIYSKRVSDECIHLFPPELAKLISGYFILTQNEHFMLILCTERICTDVFAEEPVDGSLIITLNKELQDRMFYNWTYNPHRFTISEIICTFDHNGWAGLIEYHFPNIIGDFDTDHWETEDFEIAAKITARGLLKSFIAVSHDISLSLCRAPPSS